MTTTNTETTTPATLTLGKRTYKVVKAGVNGEGFDLVGPKGARLSLVQNLANPQAFALVKFNGRRTEWYVRTDAGAFVGVHA